jgi:hypothetical protein
VCRGQHPPTRRLLLRCELRCVVWFSAEKTYALGPDELMTEFAIGQSVPRREDPRLLRGQGRFFDDLKFADQLMRPFCAPDTIATSRSLGAA